MTKPLRCLLMATALLGRRFKEQLKSSAKLRVRYWKGQLDRLVILPEGNWSSAYDGTANSQHNRNGPYERAMTRFLILPLSLMFLAAPWFGVGHYVCAATGSPCNAADSNADRSKTATWVHTGN
jgi:hypothetical protein